MNTTTEVTVMYTSCKDGPKSCNQDSKINHHAGTCLHLPFDVNECEGARTVFKTYLSTCHDQSCRGVVSNFIV